MLTQNNLIHEITELSYFEPQRQLQMYATLNIENAKLAQSQLVAPSVCSHGSRLVNSVMCQTQVLATLTNDAVDIYIYIY